MTHLYLSLLGATDLNGNLGFWLFLSIGAVALFVVFIPLVKWIETRGKEREAFYKADTIRRVAESSGEGAKAAIELLREEDRSRARRAREGLKIGGLINIAVGVGLVAFLHALIGGGVYLCGLIPGFIGVAMLVYVYLLAGPLPNSHKE
ncbi:MAG: hypothetical protein WBD67_07150 [Terracidiphilus sp.]